MIEKSFVPNYKVSLKKILNASSVRIQIRIKIPQAKKTAISNVIVCWSL